VRVHGAFFRMRRMSSVLVNCWRIVLDRGEMENHQQYLTDDKNSRTPKYLVQIYILKLIDYASDGQKNTSVLKD